MIWILIQIGLTKFSWCLKHATQHSTAQHSTTQHNTTQHINTVPYTTHHTPHRRLPYGKENLSHPEASRSRVPDGMLRFRCSGDVPRETQPHRHQGLAGRLHRAGNRHPEASRSRVPDGTLRFRCSGDVPKRDAASPPPGTGRTSPIGLSLIHI